MKQQILSYLPSGYPWVKTIHYHDTIGSTNDEAKILAAQGAPHGTVIVAGEQTGGRGRLGRSFHSPVGLGIYLSVILRPQCSPLELMHLTCAAAVAMCDAVEEAAGFRPGIKWTNDLVFGTKKLGGILTELGLNPSTGTVDYAVVGIGINCRHKKEDFPPALQEIAGSLAMVSQSDENPARVAAAMMTALESMSRQLLTGKASMMDRYRADCVTIGKAVSIHRFDTVTHATAMGVDDNGGLLVRYPNGQVETIAAGEVSIRGMYGYVN